eukprot:6184692-Pleurochrysis_carterae.AAC.1
MLYTYSLAPHHFLCRPDTTHSSIATAVFMHKVALQVYVSTLFPVVVDPRALFSKSHNAPGEHVVLRHLCLREFWACRILPQLQHGYAARARVADLRASTNNPRALAQKKLQTLSRTSSSEQRRAANSSAHTHQASASLPRLAGCRSSGKHADSALKHYTRKVRRRAARVCQHARSRACMQVCGTSKAGSDDEATTLHLRCEFLPLYISVQSASDPGYSIRKGSDNRSHDEHHRARRSLPYVQRACRSCVKRAALLHDAKKQRAARGARLYRRP